MSNISADFVLRHILARIEWAAGRGTEYVIEGYDQELIRKALGFGGVNSCPGYIYLFPGDEIKDGDEMLLLDGSWLRVSGLAIGRCVDIYAPVRRPISASKTDECKMDEYRYLGDDDFILTTDEMSECGGPWHKVDGLMNGKVKRCPHIRYRRRVSAPPIPAAGNRPCEVMQYYDLSMVDIIEDGDEVFVDEHGRWMKCQSHVFGQNRGCRSIRRPLVGCPYPGDEYKAFPKGYFVGKELKDGDAAWDGHNWLLLQSVIDNHGYIDVVLKNNFVRRKKIHL